MHQGFSGAPIWDEQLGAVIGIVLAKDLDPAARTGYGIPIQVIRRCWPGLVPWVGWRLSHDPAIASHWSPRARGVERDSRPRWYFTGPRVGIKVLVGTRPGRTCGRWAPAPWSSTWTATSYVDLDDLIEYAARSLRLDFDPIVRSPYRDDPVATATMAQAIAEAAFPSFLVAGLTARARAEDKGYRRLGVRLAATGGVSYRCRLGDG